MKLIIYELKKLSGRKYIMFLITLLLIINGITTMSGVSGDQHNAAESYVKALIDRYNDDPDGVMAEVTEVQAEYDTYIEAIQSYYTELTKNPSDAKLPQYTNRYAPQDIGDKIVMEKFFSVINKDRENKLALSNLVEQSKKRLADYRSSGTDMNSFAAKYQVGMIAAYEKELDRDIVYPTVGTFGWNNFLSYGGDGIFIIIAIVLCGSVIIIPERTSGFALILGTTRRGRRATTAAKAGAALAVCFTVTVLFSVCTLIAMMSKTEFSGLMMPVQAFYPFSVFGGSMLEAVIVKLLIRVALSYLYLCICMLISVLIDDLIIYFAASGLLTGVFYLFSRIEMFNTHSPAHLLNIFRIMSGEDYFTSWNAVDIFFGRCVDYQKLIPVIIVIFIIITLAALLNVRRRAGTRSVMKYTAVLRKLKNRFAKRNILTRIQPSGRLFCAEIRKTIATTAGVLLISVFLLAKTVSGISACNDDISNTYSDRVWKEYMTVLAGELTEEKEAYIRSEGEYIAGILSNFDKMSRDYTDHTISADEYNEYISEYNEAVQKSEIFTKVTERQKFIKHQLSDGKEAHFVYDTGYAKYFNSGADYLLAAVLILLFSGVFALEYTSGFVKVLRCTKRGRRDTFLAKTGVVMTFTLILTLLSVQSELVPIAAQTGFPDLASPVSSIPEYASANGSLLSFIIRVLLTKLLGMTVLSFLCFGLSEIFRKSIPVILVTSLFVFTAPLLNIIGIKILDPITLDNLLGGVMPYTNTIAGVSATVFSVLAMTFAGYSYQKW